MDFTETFCGHTCYMKMTSPLTTSEDLEEKAQVGAAWMAKLTATEQVGVNSISTYANTTRLGVEKVVSGNEVDLSNLDGLDDEELTMMFMACNPVELKGLDVGVAIHMEDMKPEIIINQELFGRYNKKKVKELFSTL